MPVEFAKMREIFLAALERSPGAEQEGYLALACAGDDDLRREVDLLLHAHQAAGSVPGARCSRADETRDYSIVGESAGTVIGPYKLIEQIGEGGMGTVWMAQQQEPVKRLVAVKLIKAGMDSRQVIARFEAERQALALMDHPNIARVLDAGTTDKGRPYFVMDLVKGMPITRYCDEHHLTPRQRLELFIPVCQAVQHAHQKGIIHRDLKPSNVLVARYDGKPVPRVIDFGVAKAAGQTLTDKTLVTGFEAVIGTLEYMSPEQAEINQLDIDTRSDIYSLGVLLYELLTGSPPFSRKELEKAGLLEMLRVIREEEPSKPSTKLSSSEALPTLSANRGTEPAKLTRLVRGELDWIVMKALEKDRTRRYETANGFAQDVQRYLADEAVLACPPSAGYRLRKFARRNKAGLSVAALVLFFIVLLGGGIGWAVRDRAAQRAEVERERSSRQARVSEQVAMILADAERLMAEQRWPEALITAQQAEPALASGDVEADLAARASLTIRDLELVRQLEDIRAAMSEWKVSQFDDREAARRYAAAFGETGIEADRLSAEEAARRLKARPAILAALVPALDDWANSCRRSGEAEMAAHLWTVAGLADPDAWRQQVRQAQRASDVKALLTLAGRPELNAQSANTLTDLGWALIRAGQIEPAIAVLTVARRQHPDDFWVHFTLPSALRRRSHPHPASARPSALDLEHIAGCRRAALAIRPWNTVAWSNLSGVLGDQKQYDEAIACGRKAIELDPSNSMGHLNLGVALWNSGRDLEGAIACYRRAIELDPQNAQACSNLGWVLLKRSKKIEEALTWCRRAVELDPALASAHANLGYALLKHGDVDQAIACCLKAIELDPNDGQGHNRLGIALARQRKFDQAIACYRKAIELGTDGTTAWAYFNLGLALAEQKKFDEAAACYQKAIDLEPKDAVLYVSLGTTLSEQKKVDQAIACYRKAIALDPNFAEAHSNLGAVLCNDKRDYDGAIAAFREAIRLAPAYAAAYCNLGHALRARGSPDEAIAAYRKTLELNPAQPEAHCYLGALLCDHKRDHDAASIAFREAIRQRPDYAEAHHNLGCALSGAGKLDEAIAAYQEAIRLKPAYVRAHFNLGHSLYVKRRYDEAAAALRQAIRLSPADPKAHHLLGRILSADGKSTEAVAAYREAIHINPADPETHYQLGLALPNLDEAIPAYRRAIELKPDFAEAHSALGTVLLRKGLIDEAGPHVRRAFELKPSQTMALWNMAFILDHEGKTAEAIALLSQGVESNPRAPGFHYKLAWLLATCADARLRDAERAVVLARRATELNPKDHRAWVTLGVACYRVKRLDEARGALEKACELDTATAGKGNAWQWLWLAMVHWQMGNKDQGNQWYDRAIELERAWPAELLRFEAEAAELLDVPAARRPPRAKNSMNTTTNQQQN